MTALASPAAPARSCVGEAPAFYPLEATPYSPYRPLSTRAAAARYTTPEAPHRTAAGKRAGQETPGSGHSVKRSSPAKMRGGLEPRALEFDAVSPQAPRGEEEAWAFDVVPLIPGLREADFYRSDFLIPEAFGSVISIMHLCDTIAD